MDRIWSSELKERVGERVRLAGWLHRLRRLSNVSFLILRDAKGTAQVVLELDQICRRFGGLEAIRDVCLSVPAGTRRAIIGPNGAGKTTLFNIITGELAPSSGRLQLFGRDVTRLPAHARAAMGLGRTFQITNLFGPLTVEENVLLAAQALSPSKYAMARPLSRDFAVRDRARALLEPAGLWAKRDVEVRVLSYGEQRQLEVLLALAGRPRLLLLDEPASGLSPDTARSWCESVRTMSVSMCASPVSLLAPDTPCRSR